MDSGTALIAPLMIFSIGTTTVSGLNFNPYLFILERGAKPVFCSPSISEALLPGRIGFLETIFQEVHLRPARTRLSPFFISLALKYAGRNKPIPSSAYFQSGQANRSWANRNLRFLSACLRSWALSPQFPWPLKELCEGKEQTNRP